MGAPLGGASVTVIQGRNYINGEWRDASETFESVNPSDIRETVGVFPASGKAEADEAIAAASAAFPSWKRLSRINRGEIIDNFAQLLKRDRDELIQLCAREVGKQWNESYADVIEAIHMTQFVAGYARQPNGFVVPSEIPAKDAYIIRKPKGVTVCIAPWNFPVAIPLWEVLPAVLEGNTCVLKPSPYSSACGYKLAQLLDEAGFPKGVVNVIHGGGPDCGEVLTHHPDTRLILFTGSFAVGQSIQQFVATDPIKFAACELGGKNQLLVLDDANMDIAIPAAVMSAYKTSGQRCVSVGRILVDRTREAEFTERFLDASRRLRIGNAMDRDVFTGPLVNEQGREKFERHNARAREEGFEVLLDGGRLTGGEHEHGYFVSPFVYRGEYRDDSWVLNEEAFSPHVAILPVDGLDEAIRIHNEVPYGLAAAVITEDYRKWRECREELEVGLLYVNLPSIGAEVHLPFGGMKRSGNGHPGAATLIDYVTHRTAFTVNHDHEIKMAQGLSAEL
jgi:aldehyde dehydrogenase (NAD+)